MQRLTTSSRFLRKASWSAVFVGAGIRIDVALRLDDLVDALPMSAQAHGRDPQPGLAQPAVFHLGVIAAGVLHLGRHVLGQGGHDVPRTGGDRRPDGQPGRLGGHVADKLATRKFCRGHFGSPGGRGIRDWGLGIGRRRRPDRAACGFARPRQWCSIAKPQAACLSNPQTL